MDSQLVENVVREVLEKLTKGSSGTTAPSSSGKQPSAPAITSGSRPGVFPDAESAVKAAYQAFPKLRKGGFAVRAKIIDIIKDICADNADNWGRIELEETRIGRLDHKVAKLQIIRKVPGVEWLRPLGLSGDHGISMEEHSPFGVIAAISPVTHSIPTIACNAINMIAAGNTVVVNAHPGGAKCAAMAVAAFNHAIKAQTGLENVITIIEEPSLESFNALCAAPEINLISVTGGPGVVKAAMASGKRAICAGPGNPPVVVDTTADLAKAARDIITGASFDNNLLCIGEKQVFVVDKVFDAFMSEMSRAGAGKLGNEAIERLARETFSTEQGAGGCSKHVLNRKIVGADASVLARIAGVQASPKVPLLFGETGAGHAFVEEEQMTSFLPIVRAPDIHAAIQMAHKSEHGYKHSAMIFTSNVGPMTEMGRLLDCTVFVKNGPCVAGLGDGGEGYISFSIATTTGEGITTPLTFSRRRRCVLVDALNVA